MINKANINTRYNTLGEKNLWQACIRQHIQDLFVTTISKKNYILKQEAEDFLFVENDAFEYICYLAGYSPSILRYKIRKMYKLKIQNRESLLRKVFKRQFRIRKA